MLDKTTQKTYSKTMNAPFTPEAIVPVLADVGVSITDLKRNPSAVVAAARSQVVAILNRGRAVGYVISPEFLEAAIDALEELDDIALVQQRLKEPGERIEMSIDDLV